LDAYLPPGFVRLLGMLTIYDLNTSPNCLKTKALLLELGIPYRQIDVDAETVRGAAFRAKFPTGMSPAMEDGELRISESGAIAQYLATAAGSLIPAAADRRARMYQAIAVEASLVAPTVGGQGLFGELMKPAAQQHAPRIAELRIRASQVAQVLGALLGDRPYFADELSIADFQLYAAVAKSLESGAFVDAPANLVAWCARMTARPSIVAAREQYLPYRRAA
jgi:glutathione S-transferase